MTFDEIYELVHDFTDIELKIADLDILKKITKTRQEIEQLRQQLIEIKFRLELPYKILDLLYEANKYGIKIDILNNALELYTLDDYYKKVSSDYYLNSNSSQAEYYGVVDFINSIKNKKLEEERKQQLKEAALSKLTKEEKEVLGLT